MDFFHKLEETDNQTLFIYVVVIVISIFIFKRFDIELNAVFGFMIGVILIYYIFHRRFDEIKDNKETQKQKIETIRPKPKVFQKYTDITDFIFAIQDMYPYNVQSYEDLIDSLDAFFTLYEETVLFPEEAGRNHQMAHTMQEQALFNLHGLIFELPDKKEYVEKLNNSIVELERILEKYLEEIRIMNKKHIIENGYNNRTKLILTGPDASNFHNKNYIY